jgi:hypothetical protein
MSSKKRRVFINFGDRVVGTSLVRRPVPAALWILTRKRAQDDMAIPFGETPGARNSGTIAILARTIYRELRGNGFQARDVMALAGELLAQVTTEVRSASTAPPPLNALKK